METITRMEKVRESYTSADALPIKLIRKSSLAIKRDCAMGSPRIVPFHAQFIPTNVCNLKCPFCSCAGDDRKTYMKLDQFRTTVLPVLSNLGTRAITITGGGEPLTHPDLRHMIYDFRMAAMQVGLVTNGLLLNTMDPKVLNMLTWCRISHADFRPFTDTYQQTLEGVMRIVPANDWAFSYVVGTMPNMDTIMRVIRFANRVGCTHVRLVADLHAPGEVPMGLVEQMLIENEVDMERVIVQPRATPEHGGPCRIGYLKPVISAEGKVYACCGAQYAIKGRNGSMPDELCMGDVADLQAMSSEQTPVNGSVCSVCYYGQYNRLLASLVDDIDHEAFL